MGFFAGGFFAQNLGWQKFNCRSFSASFSTAYRQHCSAHAHIRLLHRLLPPTCPCRHGSLKRSTPFHWQKYYWRTFTSLEIRRFGESFPCENNPLYGSSMCVSITVVYCVYMYLERSLRPECLQILNDWMWREFCCVRACMCACVRACMRACVHACMRACTFMCVSFDQCCMVMSRSHMSFHV